MTTCRARVLLLSWEYPPVVEGGLARHVRKLAEGLVGQGAELHVLTRGGRNRPLEENRHGVMVHRVAEPDFPKNDLDAFIAWVGDMNSDLALAGERATRPSPARERPAACPPAPPRALRAACTCLPGSPRR